MSKERPILFSAPMVMSILAGKKTQTRRVCKQQPKDGLDYQGFVCGSTNVDRIGKYHFSDGRNYYEGKDIDLYNQYLSSPYGLVGDRLWVRETTCSNTGFADYAADGKTVFDAVGRVVAWSYSRPVRPSIHMPRNQCRIVLEITDVRIERLKDISETDAVAEGIRGFGGMWKDYSGKNEGLFYPCASYKTLWEKINGSDSWSSNPWVWVIEFKRVDDSAQRELP